MMYICICIDENSSIQCWWLLLFLIFAGEMDEIAWYDEIVMVYVIGYINSRLVGFCYCCFVLYFCLYFVCTMLFWYYFVCYVCCLLLYSWRGSPTKRWDCPNLTISSAMISITWAAFMPQLVRFVGYRAFVWTGRCFCLRVPAGSAGAAKWFDPKNLRASQPFQGEEWQE